jgi:Cu/Ag efflux protein CusF
MRNGMKEHWVGIVCAAALAVAVGCSKKSDTAGASPFDAMTADKTFQTRGEVREISKEGRTAVIRHEEIPGYMPKMTMTLTVRDTNELAGLREGDEVTLYRDDGYPNDPPVPRRTDASSSAKAEWYRGGISCDPQVTGTPRGRQDGGGEVR